MSSRQFGILGHVACLENDDKDVKLGVYYEQDFTAVLTLHAFVNHVVLHYVPWAHINCKALHKYSFYMTSHPTLFT